jgi:hypothetical protein
MHRFIQSFYRYEDAPAKPIAEHCVGLRTVSRTETDLYDSIDREIARLKLGVEIGLSYPR